MYLIIAKFAQGSTKPDNQYLDLIGTALTLISHAGCRNNEKIKFPSFFVRAQNK